MTTPNRTPYLPPSNPDEETLDFWMFVPINPETCDLEQSESTLLELFGSGIAGAVMGAIGWEFLSHVLDVGEHLGGLQDAMRPQIRPIQIFDALAAWKANPRPFAKGEVPGIWVRVPVPRPRVRMALDRVFPNMALWLPRGDRRAPPAQPERPRAAARLSPFMMPTRMIPRPTMRW